MARCVQSRFEDYGSGLNGLAPMLWDIATRLRVHPIGSRQNSVVEPLFNSLPISHGPLRIAGSDR